MKKNSFIYSTLTIIFLATTTTLIYLYSAGYRINKSTAETNILTKTGMISARSIPEGASVYVDTELKTATNDTIAGLETKKYELKMTKKGFVDWAKTVDVYPELVTDITAVMVTQTPRLEPLTNTGAKNPAISPTLSKLAYFSKDTTTPGVWVMPLSQSGLSLFRATAYAVLEDTPRLKYSDGLNINWSPDEKEILVQIKDNEYYLVDLYNETVQTTTTAKPTKDSWANKLKETRTELLDKLEMSEDIKKAALAEDTLWSPDEKKFLFKKIAGNSVEYWIYNMEKPLPVGEQVETMAFNHLITEEQPNISWYSDSFHLILTYGPIEKENKGTIYLIRIDGTNKTELYNNTLFSKNVFSAPNGDKLIMLASYRSNNQTDLYTLGLR